jgi:class 3 adenylate cyclase
MAEERSQRRLAAILAADAVGFSRLMEADEAATMAALKARRRGVLDPLIARHQGWIFKTSGDGVLVKFAGAVNAVQCAIEFQAAMAVTNGDMPENLRVRHKINGLVHVKPQRSCRKATRRDLEGVGGEKAACRPTASE